MFVWNEILCLGDSITYGARDEYGRSYPAELGKIICSFSVTRLCFSRALQVCSGLDTNSFNDDT